jgi:hypothetical protein
MSTKKYILIGTTATNRSELHKTVLPEWVNYLNAIDKSNYELKWFINIDYIIDLEEPLCKTEDHFKEVIKDIDTEYIINDKKKGNFLNACKKVSLRIEDYVMSNKLNLDNVIIIWLEDDWKLNTKNIPLQEIIENYLSNLTYINLSFIRANYIHALAPFIVNYKLWSKIHLSAWKNQDDNIDPEHCVGLYYLKNLGKYNDLLNITIINKYKKINEGFFHHKMFKYNSYYTYDVENDNNIINKQYIEKKDVKNFIKDKITFVRITCSQTSDYGRNFMKKYNIEKKRIQNNIHLDFYEKKDKL